MPYVAYALSDQRTIRVAVHPTYSQEQAAIVAALKVLFVQNTFLGDPGAQRFAGSLLGQAESHKPLSPAQLAAAWKMVNPHAAQVASIGIQLPTHVEAPHRVQVERKVDYNPLEDKIINTFPYDEVLKDKIKSQPGARYNGDPDPAKRYWYIPAAQANLPALKELLTPHKFAFTPTVRDMLSFQPTAQYDEENEAIVLRLDLPTDLVRDIAELEGLKVDEAGRLVVATGAARNTFKLLKDYLTGISLDQFTRLMRERWDRLDEETDLRRFTIQQQRLALLGDEWWILKNDPQKRTLYDYQREGIELACYYERVYLAFMPGMGKTITALIAAKALWLSQKAAYPDTPCAVHVICPASVRDKNQWQVEAYHQQVPVIVNSWHQIPDAAEINYPFVLIADEAHKSSNYGTEMAKRFLGMAQHPQCVGVLCLSGTPARNGRPSEMAAALQAIQHPVMQKGFRKFQKAFNKKSQLEHLRRLIKDVVLYRDIEDSLDLPEFNRIMYDVPENEYLQAMYREKMVQAKERYQAKVAEGVIQRGAEAAALLTAALAASSHCKVEATLELARSIIEDNNETVVIFTWFVATAKTLATQLGSKAAAFTGETSTAQRRQLLEAFQNGQLKALVITIGAGGTGIDGLQNVCSYVIMHDRSYVPSDVEQAEGRIYRVGQGQHVQCYWMNYHLIDHAVNALIERKNENIELLFGNQPTFSEKAVIQLADVIANEED